MWGFSTLDPAEVGDHVLVCLFQPMKGKWHQVLGCFLAKGNIKGKALAKLILEGIHLSEDAGLYVDGIISDGARWNRNMWEHFGVGEATSACNHPCNPERNLWFFSDWCHLLKCMRNALCPLPSKKKVTSQAHQAEEEMEETQIYMELAAGSQSSSIEKDLITPDGIVRRRHWVAVWNEEERLIKQHKLRYVPNLSRKHIFPTGFQRMNVSMAFQFFGNATRAGMKWYRERGVPALEDSEPSEQLIQKIDALAHAMNSGGSAGALWEGCKEEKAIQDYTNFHQQCIALAKENGKRAFWSDLTDLGITVTLRSTLELTKYLREKLDFKYVMTKRFNQDALEQFFGHIRRSAGPNPHPDPKLFAQLYRLLSMYSLVSPKKGSNISGVSNVEALINASDRVGEEISQRNKNFNELLDEILEHGAPIDELPLPLQAEHNYDSSTTEIYLIQFMAGFTAFRQQKLAKNCNDCLRSLIKNREDANENDAWAAMKEMHGGYTYPSDTLASLIRAVEYAACDCISNHGVHKEMAFTTLRFLRIQVDCFVGCHVHSIELTKAITKYYLFVRMFFSAGMKNSELERLKDKSKQFSKQSRL